MSPAIAVTAAVSHRHSVISNLVFRFLGAQESMPPGLDSVKPGWHTAEPHVYDGLVIYI